MYRFISTMQRINIRINISLNVLGVNFDHLDFKMHYDRQNFQQGLFSDVKKRLSKTFSPHLHIHFIYYHSVETKTIFNISIILAFESFYFSR